MTWFGSCGSFARMTSVKRSAFFTRSDEGYLEASPYDSAQAPSTKSSPNSVAAADKCVLQFGGEQNFSVEKRQTLPVERWLEMLVAFDTVAARKDS